MIHNSSLQVFHNCSHFADVYDDVNEALRCQRHKSDNIVAVFREFTQLPLLDDIDSNNANFQHSLCTFFDIKNGKRDERLAENLQELKSQLMHYVPSDLVLKCSVPWQEILSLHHGLLKPENSVYLGSLCKSLEKKLILAINLAVESQKHFTRAVAMGKKISDM